MYFIDSEDAAIAGVTPVGAAEDKVTVPLNLWIGETFNVEVTVVPDTTEKYEGEAERAKSGLITWIVMLTEWVSVPSALFPTTMTLYWPETADDETPMVSVVFAAWLYLIDKEAAARLAVIALLVVVADKVMVPLNLANE